MKYKNLKEKYHAFDLQFFAEGSEGDDGGEGAGDDDQDGDDSDDDGEDADEKRFSQKDLDDAIKKRVAREKRKWQKEQQKSKDSKDGREEAGDDGKDSEKEGLEKERKRNEKLTMRLACYEAGVAKDSVKDVTALARAYMEDDEDLDFEDAIEKVLKKYPALKAGSEERDDNEKGSWGQRHRGKNGKEKSLDDEITEALFGK